METTKTINELVNEFVNYQDVTEGTRANYKTTLQIFVNWMVKSGIDVGNPTRPDIIRYKKHLTEIGRTPTTINSYLISVRRFYEYCEHLGYYENIAAGIRSPRQGQTFIKGYLKPKQVQHLLEQPDRTTHIGKRDYAILMLMCYTGCRCCEVSRLTLSDIYTEDGNAFAQLLRKGKDTKQDVVLLPVVFNAIEDYIADVHTTSTKLFANLQHHNGKGITSKMVGVLVSKYLKKAGLYKRTKVTAHSLRHSAAITALRNGIDIERVSKLLGHADTKTTHIYLRALQAEEDKNNPAAHALGIAYAKQPKTAQNGQISPPL